MIGRIIQELQVVEKVPTPKGKSGRRGPYYRCHCLRCGNDIYVATSGDLLSGRIRSCGCYRNSQEFADAKVVHGHRRQNKGTTSRTYSIWCEMKRRCDNPLRENFEWYGGRGISYDRSWANFQCFLEDMGEVPEGLELGRIDNSGNYSKENCRWITHKENCQNRGGY